ncbi:MAG: TRAP transporter substrate-binding protein [Propioniciclava sp.]
MKRTALRWVAAVCVPLLALTACTRGGGAGTTTTDPGGTAAGAADCAPAKLVLGHAGSDTDPRQNAAESLAEKLSAATDGNLTAEVHGNSTLGTWEEMVEGLQLGTTDIVIESLLSLESYSNLASIETAPFLYDSPEQFAAVWDGALGDEIKGAITEATGYAILGNMYRGPRELTTKTPVTQLSDLQGQTIRTPSAQTMVETWQALGARAEALPWSEVYSALEQGVIDGQENPLDVAVFNDIYEVAPELTQTSHMYANYHFLMWNDSLNGLCSEYQEVVRTAAAEVGADYTATTAANQETYRTELESKGMTFHELTDREAWVEATQPVIETLPEQVQAWVEHVRGMS